MKETLSFRADPALRRRIVMLSKASGLKKNTIIEKCIEAHLPTFEEKYAQELLAMGRYPSNRPGQHHRLNEK